MKTDAEILRIANAHSGCFDKKFSSWITKNLHVFAVFHDLADRLWRAGRTKYSSRTIGEKMRFDHAVREADGEFKLNNNYTPDLGRLYCLLNPDRVELFAYRRGGWFKDYVVKQVALGNL